MNSTPRLLDVVALLADLPSHGVGRGQVGIVVALLRGACEVEFSDDKGRTFAQTVRGVRSVARASSQTDPRGMRALTAWSCGA